MSEERLQEIITNFKGNLIDYIDNLQQENSQLKERIEKAIEYIKGTYEMAIYTKSISLDEENIEELLEILKGDSNE